jgi:hypothetical protein
MNRDNRRRALTDVVDVEAWHEPYSPAVRTAELHVDVTFGIGRVGGDSVSPIRFQLSLRRAEVVVVVPKVEPAKVLVHSVARSRPRVWGETIRTMAANSDVSGKAEIGGALSPHTPRLAATAKGSASRSRQNTARVVEHADGAMRVVQSRTEDGDYRWTVTALTGVLDGKPWDASASSQMTIEDTRSNRGVGIAPAVRVQVRCRREDIKIDEIVLKDRRAWATIKRSLMFRNKIAAAEAAIRQLLIVEGLFAGEISDPYLVITLAEVSAEDAPR